jgi:hypothetical protein
MPVHYFVYVNDGEGGPGILTNSPRHRPSGRSWRTRVARNCAPESNQDVPWSVTSITIEPTHAW